MGATANYIARLVGTPATMDNYVHIRADVLSSVTNHVDPTRVLVKMTLADYYLVKHAMAPLKISRRSPFRTQVGRALFLTVRAPMP